MATFKFYENVKMTVWERTHYSVNAESYEQAVELMMSKQNDDIFTPPDDSITTLSQEIVDSSYEIMSPADNDGQPTFELYNIKGVLLGTNVPDNQLTANENT